jgi:hypothetical protein
MNENNILLAEVKKLLLIIEFNSLLFTCRVNRYNNNNNNNNNNNRQMLSKWKIKTIYQRQPNYRVLKVNPLRKCADKSNII